jgi:hypothetical protein
MKRLLIAALLSATVAAWTFEPRMPTEPVGPMTTTMRVAFPEDPPEDLCTLDPEGCCEIPDPPDWYPTPWAVTCGAGWYIDPACFATCVAQYDVEIGILRDALRTSWEVAAEGFLLYRDDMENNYDTCKEGKTDQEIWDECYYPIKTLLCSMHQTKTDELRVVLVAWIAGVMDAQAAFEQCVIPNCCRRQSTLPCDCVPDEPPYWLSGGCPFATPICPGGALPDQDCVLENRVEWQNWWSAQTAGFLNTYRVAIRNYQLGIGAAKAQYDIDSNCVAFCITLEQLSDDVWAVYDAMTVKVAEKCTEAQAKFRTAVLAECCGNE